jgi:hypothetical protein
MPKSENDLPEMARRRVFLVGDVQTAGILKQYFDYGELHEAESIDPCDDALLP